MLRQACAYAQSDQSLCKSLEYSMNVQLLTKHHLESLSLNGGCAGSSEPTLVKMPRCWKSHATAHIETHFAHNCVLEVCGGYLQQNKGQCRWLHKVTQTWKGNVCLSIVDEDNIIFKRPIWKLFAQTI